MCNEFFTNSSSTNLRAISASQVESDIEKKIDTI